MIVVNFAHPLTDEQRAAVARLAGRAVERVITVAVQLNDAAPFAPQVAEVVAAVGLSSEEWQTLPLVVNLPGHSGIAAVLLAQLHGLMGHFPTVLRLRRADALGTFMVAELLSLQELRDESRRVRG